MGRLLFLVCFGSEIDFNQRRISQRRRQSESAAAFYLLWFFKQLGPASRKAKGDGKVTVLSVFGAYPLGGPPFWFTEFALSTVAVGGYKSLID